SAWFEQQSDRFRALFAPLQDGVRYAICTLIQLIVSPPKIFRFKRQSVRVCSDNFFQALRERLLDLFFRKLNKRPRRVNTLSPNRLLFLRERGVCSRGRAHDPSPYPSPRLS